MAALSISIQLYFCMLLKEKSKNPKKYPARPGNALLGITDAKEEIIMSNKIYFQTADRRVCP